VKQAILMFSWSALPDQKMQFKIQHGPRTGQDANSSATHGRPDLFPVEGFATLSNRR
jgi:hypothetical protein